MELTSQNDTLYKGFIDALLCSALIILITFVLPQHGSFLFVGRHGGFALLPQIGPLLALSFMLRWRMSRRISIALFGCLLPFVAFEASAARAPYFGYSLVFLLDIALLYILVFQQDLRSYLREG